MTDTFARIAELNDHCRLGLDRNARIVITHFCFASLAQGRGAAAEILAQAPVMAAVRRYALEPTDGAERDRGELVVAPYIVRFKIDYYDPSLEWVPRIPPILP